MRKVRSRRGALQLGALAAAVAVTIAACGSDDGGFADDGGAEDTDAADDTPPPAEEVEDITLTVLVNVTDHLSQEWWDELVVPFEEANPGVTVDILGPVQGESVASTITQLIAAGDMPDVVHNLRPDRDNREVLLDLSDQEWLAQIPLASSYAIEGAQYMTHAGTQLQGLWFYNKDAFAEAGVTELPTTISELEAAMDSLADAGYTPVQTASAFVTQQSFWGLAVPSVVGNDPDWYANIRSGATTFGDTYGPWLERWEQWRDAEYFDSDAMGLTYDDATAAFFAGESAIYPMGSWLVGLEADAEIDFEVGVMAPPVADETDARILVGNAGMMFAVTNTTEHQDAAVDLVEWLTTDPGAVAEVIERDGDFRDGFDVDRTPLGEEVQNLLVEIGADNVVPSGDGYGENWVPAGFGGEVNTELQGLWIGQSAEDIASTIDDWIEQNNE